jgi:hypothetical protein
MSEGRSYFKIKKGDIEIEYSGLPKDVDSKYKEAFDWVKTAIITTSVTPRGPTAGPKQPRKPGRGGHRSPIISNAIDRMISDGEFDKAKTTSQALDYLVTKAVPGVTNFNVDEALKRKTRQGILDRIKGAGEEYSYIKRVAKKT